MSMMANPGGGGQIIAAGQPFKVRLRKKKTSIDDPPENAADTAETDEPDNAADADDPDGDR
ncbi:MAG: hypothetical protein WCA46_29645 [Actinocatenispora sp.]